MNKYIFIALLFLSISSFGQPGRDGNPARPDKQKLERIHAAKIAYITDRLHLSQDQGQKFIPVYNDFDKARVDLFKSFQEKSGNKNPEDMPDDSARAMVENNLDFQEQLIQLKRKYNDQFLKVITPQQLANLRIAEHEFRQTLIQIRNNRQQQHHGGGRRGNEDNYHTSNGNRY